MKNGLRNTGISVIGDCRWGTHICMFCRTREDLIDILVPYFKAGLENNEFCMWVTSAPLSVKQGRAALCERLPALDEFLARGQIEILDYHQWYTKSGKFDADLVLAGWVGKLEQALEKGFDGLRLTGNTFWLEKKDWKAFTDYEAAVNQIIGRYPMIALCSYSLDRCDASEIIDVISNHQFALTRRAGKWEQIESSELKRADEALRQAYAELEQRVQQRTADLARANQELRAQMAERERAEAALRQSEARLQFQREQMPVGCIFWDGEFRVSSWNPAAEKIFGYTAAEALGKKPYGFIVAEGARLHVEAVWRRLLQGDTTAHSVNDNLTKDGRTIVCDWVNAPLRQADGQTLGVLSMVQDITERRRAEMALRQSEEQLRQFARRLEGESARLNEAQAVAHVGSWELDLRTTILIWSDETYRIFEMDAARFGASYEAFLALVHPDDREKVNQAYTESVRLRAPYAINHRMQMADGRLKVVHERGETFYDDHGRPLRSIGTVQDITEQVRAEEEIHQLNAELEQRVRERTAQLEAANKELEAFCYSVSHDLRAPLRSIDGFSRILLEDYADKLDEEGRDSLQRVRAATGRMDQLIDDLLKLSRVTRCELLRSAVDLSALAENVIRELQSINPPRPVEFIIAPDVKVAADPNLLRIVLENLLGNAWKFTSKRSQARIELGVAASPGEWVCFIRDNGVGFDEKYAHRLFGAFQRLHTPEEFPGTGVGLATVQRIVRRHGGRVWAESKRNHGACFYFSLPS